MRKRCDMVYGAPGIGKTVFVSTALEVEAFKPILMLMTDDVDSIESKVHVLSKEELTKPVHDKLNVYTVRNWLDVADAHDVLTSKTNPYKTVILDTLSEINDMAIDYAQGHQSTVRLTLVDNPDQQEYRSATNLMLDLVRSLKLVDDLNVIMTAHVDVRKSEVTELQEIKPLLTRKLSSAIPGKCKFVIYLTMGNGDKRVGKYQPSGRIVAKDMTENSPLGKEMTEPSYKKIMEKLSGNS